jgi:hypothetical protein
MAYSDIINTRVAVGAPLDTALLTALRDNIVFSAIPISTTIITTAVASVDFTGFDPSQFNSYEIELQNVIPVTDSVALYLRTSSDGGATYDSGATDYTYGAIIKRSSNTDTTLQSNGAAQGEIEFSIGSGTNEDGISGKLQIVGPHLAKRTAIMHQTVSSDATGLIRFSSGGILRMASADVDAVQLLFSSGNIESGTIIFRGFK